MGDLISISGSRSMIPSEPPGDRSPCRKSSQERGAISISYLLVPGNTLGERIAAARARLFEDVAILGHHYQRDEVIEFSDFRGDSLKLSVRAAETYSRYIAFCGVHFTAESADILRRKHQLVVLPDRQRRLFHGRHGRHRPSRSLLE